MYTLAWKIFLTSLLIYVVLQLYPWMNFDFSLFFSMLICDNEYQTKENCLSGAGEEVSTPQTL